MESLPASPPVLRLLGGAAIQQGDRVLGGAAAHRHRIALLALLGSARRPMTRDKLVAYLWPERDREAARNLLKTGIHELRKLLGEDAIVGTGDQLSIDRSLLRCDVADFDDAVQSGNFETAAALYDGPFLDGFFMKDAPEFERWADAERTRLASSHAAVLEQLAKAAELRGDAQGAVRWWRTLAVSDPLRSDVALRLMRALAAAGDRAAAIRHATVHATIRRDDLALEADPAVAALAEELTATPAPVTSTAVIPFAAASAIVPADDLHPPAPRPGPAEQQAPRVRTAIAAGIALVVVTSLVLLGLRTGSARDAGRKAQRETPLMGERGAALSFDGSANASTPLGTILTTLVDNIAVDAMVKYDGSGSAANHQMIFYNGHGGLSGWGIMVLDATEGRQPGTIAIISGGIVAAATPLVLAPGTWQHLSAERREGRITVSLDASTYDVGAIVVNPLGATHRAEERTTIGGDGTFDHPTGFFHGSIARVRVRDLANDYLIEQWNFDEGRGSTATGVKGTVLHVGGARWTSGGQGSPPHVAAGDQSAISIASPMMVSMTAPSLVTRTRSP